MRRNAESKLWRAISERCLIMARMKEHSISAPYTELDMAKNVKEDLETLWAIDSTCNYDNKLKDMLSLLKEMPI